MLLNFAVCSAISILQMSLDLKIRETIASRKKADPLYDKVKKSVDKSKPLLHVGSLRSEYMLAINDDSVLNPFLISTQLINVIRSYTEQCNTPEQIARSIFTWMQDNITYGDNVINVGYQNSVEILKNKTGICGEMAFLFTTMARCCGLQSSWVDVKVDYRGKSVHHACSSVRLRKEILVDPAYNTFDIKHKKYVLLNDAHAIRLYNQWR